MHSTSLLITLLWLAAISITASASAHNQLHQQHQLKMSRSLNVLSKPLAIHSTSPMTGYLRNGYCEVPASDAGNHAIAAEVSDEFLKFSADRGNDLRQIGLKGGCKWCLCVSRWKEAFDARGKEGDKIVPKIFLNATNEKALDKVSLEDLKKFAVDKE
ncbi:hypothetical protein D6D12_07803 [Aureobasidium pullulans]|uniref:Thioredoxin domain-containing protein n=1 Tax=Aureobasidium pullulans TaxID=5580 RepID=A0AB74JLZ3_AURPU|nr:hypothetical protein D6D12_07803 [Aureobasidium pullulans]THX40800.1 hypothetical protein D6D11_08607 [Aureobasidium pullulans]